MTSTTTSSAAPGDAGQDGDGLPDRTHLAELARLRRRAYGRDADAALDAASHARLMELERRASDRSADAARSAETSSDSGRHPGPPPPIAAPEAATAASVLRPPDAVAHEAVDENPAESSPAPRVGFWRGLWALLRDRRVWAIAGVAGVVGAVLAIGVTASMAPRPYAVLQGASGIDDRAFDAYRENIGAGSLSRERMHAYESAGNLRPWLVDDGDDGECLYITVDDTDLVAIGCVNGALRPIVDVDLSGVAGSSLRGSGSVRFLVRDDVVELWFGDQEALIEVDALRSGD